MAIKRQTSPDVRYRTHSAKLSGARRRSAVGPVVDRRMRRSRDLLFRALIELILEKKSYDRITVQDILDRADVGRSTFYSHYQSKDQLLLSATEGLRAVLDQAVATTPSASPSAPIFQAAQVMFSQMDDVEHRRLYRAVLGTRAAELVTRKLRKLLSTALAENFQSRGRVKDRSRREAAGAFVANGLVGLLYWWVDSGSPLTSKEAYAMFERLAAPGIEALADERIR